SPGDRRGWSASLLRKSPPPSLKGGNKKAQFSGRCGSRIRGRNPAGVQGLARRLFASVNGSGIFGPPKFWLIFPHSLSPRAGRLGRPFTAASPSVGRALSPVRRSPFAGPLLWRRLAESFAHLPLLSAASARPGRP